MKKRGKAYLCSLLAAIFMFAFCPVAYGENSEYEENDKTLAPYFVIEGEDSQTDRFPLKDTQVTANINGVIADIYVTQTYSNDGDKPINASYVFPASTKVSVHGMKMEIGDKVVTAKIKEREEAKEEFERAKEEGKSASLLEQQRPNVFSMSVANIMPGDMVKIELHYTELIVSTDNVYEFAFPTVVGPRYSNQPESQAPESDKWVASPYLGAGKTPPGKYGITVNLTTGIPIQDLICKSHKVDVSWAGDKEAEITLADSEDFAGNRDYILDYRLTGEGIQSGMMLYKGENENFFMMMVQPPERIETESIPPREYIFVLDVSGSMNGYPLDTAKKLIRNLISNLRATDRFNLILFAGASNIMSSSSVQATEENIKKAENLVDRQDGGGGTELLSALEKAVLIPKDESFSRSVVLITDGYIDGEKGVFELINKNLNETNFFSFGIGSSVNRYLIEGVAKAGQGEPFVVTEESEASDVAARFREYVQSPVLTNIDVKYDGFDVYDVEPLSIPDMFAQRPVILFGKWRGEAAGSIHITGTAGNSDYNQVVQVSGTEPLDANSAIRYLWARSRVERLTDYSFGNNNTDTKGEVTSIGLNYSMLTPYTSFIAVIDTIRNTDGKSTDVNQPLPLPLGVSELAVGGGYTNGSEPGFIVLMAGVLIMTAIIILGKRRRKAINGCVR